MIGVEIVLEAGPIPYQEIPLHGDPDLEHGLRHAGFEPEATWYRFIEIPLDAIGDVRTMSGWQHIALTSTSCGQVSNSHRSWSCRPGPVGRC
jgi:hypothetical protein